MIFHEMTWPELQEADRRAIVVLPLGSTEQHGPHLPVDTDARLVQAICLELERRQPRQVMLAPTSWLGHSPHHLSFGGTLSLRHNIHAEMLVEMVECFDRMGYQRILMVNGHGGNSLPMGMAQQEVKLRMPRVQLLACSYWELARQSILALREGGTYGMGHACELETSLYLYLHPQGVRRECIADGGRADSSGYFGMGMFNGGPVSYVSDFREFTENGVFGKPTLASQEKGEKAFEAIVQTMELFVQDFYEKKSVLDGP